MAKFDPFHHKEKYLSWKERAQSEIADLTEYNAKTFMRYITDMECGLNIAVHHKKGSRSYLRLNAIRTRILYLMRGFQNRLNLTKVTDITEEQIHHFFLSMRNGDIRRQDGGIYKSVKDYVQDFKAFWHWWMKVNKKQGIEIQDICVDLDTSGEKPKWVYLTEDQVRLLAENAHYKYKVAIWFLFDTGIRAPTELLNVKVGDLYNDYKELNIRQETSKTFGRRIKIMLCSALIKEYIEKNNLSKDDYLFRFSPSGANRYLKRLAKKLFGEKESLAGEKYSELTLYDFRHCSSCYWLPRYKTESAIKYRFGWIHSEKIHYYSELLGMRDTISDDDMLLDTSKIEIEKRLELSEKERKILQERVDSMEKDHKEMKEYLEILKSKMIEREQEAIALQLN